jgi:hypothetical protein
MSGEDQTGGQSAVRELDREGRRLARLRLVTEQTNAEQQDDRANELDPDPKQAA